MKKIILVAVLAAELLAAPPAPAQGVLQISNLGATSIGEAMIGDDFWIAQSFTTGTNPSGYTLNSIQLLMNAASGSADGFSVFIYRLGVIGGSNGTDPGYPIRELVGPDPAGGGLFTYTTTSGLLLSPSTFYAIVLSATSPLTQGGYVWSATSAPLRIVNPTTGWEIDNYYYSSTDHGFDWTFHPRQYIFQLAIYATPVPEPSALALLALGGGVLLYARQRKPRSTCVKSN